MPKAKSKATVKLPTLKLFDHQQKVVDAFKRGIRKFFLVWHRRGGKDTFGLDFARERMEEQPANYWHLFPAQTQARRAIWNGIDKRDGRRFIDRAFPDAIRESTNATEMSISTRKGAFWQMLGSDNYDRMVGSNPAGIVFSEWALCDPAARDYISPILMENKGWEMYITTFRGRNHAWRMYNTVKDLPDWYVDVRTIRDTVKHNGQPIMTDAEVEKQIKEGMSRARAMQEFYCDPMATNIGTVLARHNTFLNATDPIVVRPSERTLRVAWGMNGAGIAAVAFTGKDIYGVHQFPERDIIECVQAVARRHPNRSLIHHGKDLDPTIFCDLDGAGMGVIAVPSDKHMVIGNASMFLSGARATSAAREQLIDFTGDYTPFRDPVVDDTAEDAAVDTGDALLEALAIANGVQPVFAGFGMKPMDYSQIDRGVI